MAATGVFLNPGDSRWALPLDLMQHRTPPISFALLIVSTLSVWAQVDPYSRSLLQLGYDYSLTGKGPQSLYAYYYYNNPAFLNTNIALRMAVAPVYLDSELGFRGLLSPHTDVGLGISGGGFYDNYYEIRQGHYLKEESFDGHGGGASLNLYQRINPRQTIPLHAVVQGGFHYSTYSHTDRTADTFQIPPNRDNTFLRAGLRFAGKEPMLYPDLAMEVSVWFERQWRFDGSTYGYAGDPRQVEPMTDLYWCYAGLNYAWTNTGHQFTFGLTLGGSDRTDRFSAWRLGGVLPLASEYPLMLPGYYYQELSARQFAHFIGSYAIPLSADHRWQARLEAASVCLDYLPGFELRSNWQTGVGTDLSYTSRNQVWRVILRYGYGINAIRDGHQGAHSAGLLCQYNFKKLKEVLRSRQDSGR
jgi:hypothetical protein